MKPRLLIIDADEQLNMINEKVLISAGISSEIHIARNGSDAIEYLRSRALKKYPLPNIIILDIQVHDGFHFIDEFKGAELPGKAYIELVVFTSSSSAKDRQKAQASGIRYYLNKPYLLRGLRDVLAQLRVEKTDVHDNRRTFGLERIP